MMVCGLLIASMCMLICVCVCVSYLLATRSSQMNVEAANDLDPKY